MRDPLLAMAFDLGQQVNTPFYVFSASRLDSAVVQFGAFTDSLPIPAEFFYSYKTNYLPAICDHLASRGVGAEVTSLMEWQAARSRLAPDRIVVNGIGKCAGGLLAGIVADQKSAPRLVNLETDTEIAMVVGRNVDAVRLPVGLRVTVPQVSGEHGRDPSEHWSRGTAKFGWSTDGDAIIRAARQLTTNPAVQLEALHLHFGSQLVSPARYDTVIRHTIRLLRRLQAAGIAVSTLDLGGGLASGWVTKRRTGPLFDLLRAVGVPVPIADQRMPDLDGIAEVFRHHATALNSLGVSKLVFEPGRILAEPAMLAIASVIAVRRDANRRHAVLDIGTNALHCWRGNETRPILFNSAAAGPAENIKLVGPLCHRSDTFGTATAPGPLRVGDLVCLDAVGAYSIGDWIANAWSRPPVYDEHGKPLWSPLDHGIAPALAEANHDR